MKCLHFSDDMVFWLALVIFQFFSDENQDIDFSWPFIAIVGGEVETSSMHNKKKKEEANTTSDRSFEDKMGYSARLYH